VDGWLIFGITVFQFTSRQQELSTAAAMLFRDVCATRIIMRSESRFTPVALWLKFLE
jgi:hypothetical protein